MSDAKAVLEGLTLEPWASATFTGWTVRSKHALPERLLRDDADINLKGILCGDVSEHEMLLLLDGDSPPSNESVLEQVHALIEEQKV